MSLTLIQVICISFVLRFEFLGFLEIFMTVFHLMCPLKDTMKWNLMPWQYSFRVTDSLERIENINYKKRMLYVNLRFMLLSYFPTQNSTRFQNKSTF